jgi:hypothetical protein
METMSERPVGVTILAILTGGCGIGALGLGIRLAALYYAVANFEQLGSFLFLGIFNIEIVTLYFGSVVAFFIILGILDVIIAFGMWNGVVQTRWLAFIVLGLTIFLGLTFFPAGIVPTVVSLPLLWYLMQPNVKAFFGDEARLKEDLCLVLLPIPFASLASCVFYGTGTFQPFYRFLSELPKLVGIPIGIEDMIWLTTLSTYQPAWYISSLVGFIFAMVTIASCVSYYVLLNSFHKD